MTSEFKPGEIYCYFDCVYHCWQFFIALNQSNLLFFGESKITKHSQAVENDEHFLTIEQFEDLEKRLKTNDYI